MQIEDSAEEHNRIWKLQDLTDAYNSGDFSRWVASGKFTNIFPGCYIRKTKTIDGVTYTDHIDIIVECDPYISNPNSAVDSNSRITEHHVMIIPLNPMTQSYVNQVLSTAGGYIGSFINTTILPKYLAAYQNAYGSDHFLPFRAIGSHTVQTDLQSTYPSKLGSPVIWEAFVTYTALLSEINVFGSMIFSNPFDCSEVAHQLAGFRLCNKLRFFGGIKWWIRGVVSNEYFAFVGVGGQPGWWDVNSECGVRPFFLLK